MEIDEVILNNIGTLIQSLINLLGILAAGILIHNLVSRLDANVQLDKIKKEYKDDVNKFLEILIVINNDKKRQSIAESKINKDLCKKLKNLYSHISMDPPKEYSISEMYLKVDSVLFFDTVLQFNNFYNKNLKHNQNESFFKLKKLSESFIDKGIELYIHELKINKALQKHMPRLLFIIIFNIFLFVIIYYLLINQKSYIIIYNITINYLSIFTILSNILALFCLLYTSGIVLYLLKTYKE